MNLRFLCLVAFLALGRTAAEARAGADEPAVPAGPNAVAWLTTDVEGVRYQDVADPAEICPAGWQSLGTGPYTVACTTGRPGVTVRITESVEGVDAASDPGGVCPDGWEHVGGAQDASVCHREGPGGPPAYLSENLSGLTSATADDLSALCPAGWPYLGAHWGYEAVCQAPVGTSLIYLRADGQQCPDTWEHVGGAFYTIACAKADAGAVGELAYTRDGRAFRTLRDPGEVCPAGWDPLGHTEEGVLCEAPAPGVVLALSSGTDSVPRARDLADPGALCPEGTGFVGVAEQTVACVDY